MKDIAYKITLNFRKEWNAVIGNQLFYMNSIIDSCFGNTRTLLLVSDYERDGFNLVTPKSSGFSYSTTLKKLEKVGVFFMENTIYRCAPIDSYIMGCMMYEVSEELVADKIFDYGNPLTFSLGNPWYTDGSMEISRENMPEFKLYRSVVDRLTNKAKKTDYFDKHIDPKKKLALRDEDGNKLYHTDHKFSVWQGFQDKLPPELIASLANLCVLEGPENLSKGKKCSILIGVLLSEDKRIGGES